MTIVLVDVRGPAPILVNRKDGRGPAVVLAGDVRGGPSQLNSWSGRKKEGATVARREEPRPHRRLDRSERRLRHSRELED